MPLPITPSPPDGWFRMVQGGSGWSWNKFTRRIMKERRGAAALQKRFAKKKEEAEAAMKREEGVIIASPAGSAGKRISRRVMKQNRRAAQFKEIRLAKEKEEAEAAKKREQQASLACTAGPSGEESQEEEDFEFEAVDIWPAPPDDSDHAAQQPGALSEGVLAHLPTAGISTAADDHECEESVSEDLEGSSIEDMDESSNGGVPSALTRAASPCSRETSFNVNGGFSKELEMTPPPAPGHEQCNRDRFKRPLPERLIRPRRGCRVFNQQEWELLAKAFLDLPVGANGMPKNGDLTELAQRLEKPHDKVRSWFTETRKQLLPECIKKRTSMTPSGP